MSRIKPLQPPYSAEIQAQFDQIMPPGVPPLMLFRVMATSERAWRKFSAASLLDRGPLTLRDREILILRVCALARCEYEWGVHITAFAAKAKLMPDQIKATVNHGADAGCWAENEQALIAAIDALHARSTLDKEEFTKLRVYYDEYQILEILMLAGFYKTVSYIANSLDLPLEVFAARFSMQSASR